ncbi:MAG: hypothetical protein U0736_04960 [Gemmataceae bacterium]
MVGTVRQPGIRGGNLVAEGWFHEDATRDQSPTLYQAALAGGRSSCPPGAYIDDEPAPPGSICPHRVSRTRPSRATSRPDHVAVLPDGRGVQPRRRLWGKRGPPHHRRQLEGAAGARRPSRRTHQRHRIHRPAPGERGSRPRTLSATLDGLAGQPTRAT